MQLRVFSHAVIALAGAVLTLIVPLVSAAAEPDAKPSKLPVFVPHTSDWAPDYTVFPYNLWQTRVTSEQVDAERESCQWFNAQYDTLMGQVLSFQHQLGDQHDNWTAPGGLAAADIVTANLDQSADFLNPRAHILFITNYPDQSQYSPLYNGDSIYHLWCQLTQISDRMKQKQPAGLINANIATANVYGRVIHDSTVCNVA